MKALFIAALFLCLGAVGAIQWNEETEHRAAMHEALQPVCFDLPRYPVTKVAQQ